MIHKILLLVAAISFTGVLNAATSGEDCSQGLTSSWSLLNTALHNIYSFDYVRTALAKVKTQYPNAEFCVSGMVLSRNEYQYPRFYIQVIARDATTKATVHNMRLLFQDASVQALDNFGSTKPWVGLDANAAQTVVGNYVIGLSLNPLAVPFDPLAIAQNSATYKGCNGQIDAATLGVLPVGTLNNKEFYIVSWLTQPGGNIFANYPMLKGVLVTRDLPSGAVSISENLMLTSGLDFPLQDIWAAGNSQAGI